MKICYFDESGDGSVLNSQTCSNQPAFIIAGIIIDSNYLKYLTGNFLDLKRKYFKNLPHDPNHHLSWILSEIKGSKLRSNISENRNTRRHTIGFLLKILGSLSSYDVKLIGSVWVKQLGQEFKHTAVYTKSVQNLYDNFQKYLEDVDDIGVVVGDSRNSKQNTVVAHGIFSQKMSANGDPFDRIVDIPSFSHSNNSTGLQVSDIIASAILWPYTMETFCKGIIRSTHIKNGYDTLKERTCSEVRNLQYRYTTPDKKRFGGIWVKNHLSNVPNGALFSTKKFSKGTPDKRRKNFLLDKTKNKIKDLSFD